MDSYTTSIRQVALSQPLEDGLSEEERKAIEASDRISDHPMDSEEAVARHRQILEWLYHERDRQAENRREMALDQDFKDGIQWSEEDAAEVISRGQKPLVYNEILVQVNWITGTEKRTRIDHRVLPREEDDVEAAAVKTKVLKYVDDVNRSAFARSAAFEEAVTCGLSWLEDSLSDDGTEEIIYSGWESWRNVLHDSHSRDILCRDMRYVIRWRVLDLDVAIAMWPDRANVLRMAAAGSDTIDADAEDEIWYLGNRLSDRADLAGMGNPSRRTFLGESVRGAFNRRTRVRVYECWYRVPEQAEVVRGGQFDGLIYDPTHAGMRKSIESGVADAIPSRIMRMRVAYFTEGHMLQEGPSPFRHNDFPLTPVWCYRRGRDGMPFGIVRNLRDPQEDLNHRMSKSLFLLAVNQLVTEYGAFDTAGEYTLQDAIDNVKNPNGVFVMRDGSKRFEIRRDYAEMNWQNNIAQMDRMFMQSASGVTDELLGRKTNAVSGSAIEARQEQGSIATMTPFSNLRLAVSISGAKKLANCEQFMTLPKVIRLTTARASDINSPDFTKQNPGDGIEWVRVNHPEIQPDGTVRFINDMTASRADFIVDEQDYRASMRQAMFGQLAEMLSTIAPIAPQFAVSMLDLMVDMADFPGKTEMVQRLRALIAEFRGAGPKDPEQVAAEAASQQLLMRKAAAEIAEREARADKMDAEADKIRSTLTPDMVALDLQRTPQGAQVNGAAALPPVAGGAATSINGAAPAASSPPPPLGAAGPAAPPNPVADQALGQLVIQLAQIVQAAQEQARQGSAMQAATARALEGVAASIAAMSDSMAAVTRTSTDGSNLAVGAAKSVEVLAEAVKEIGASVDASARAAETAVSTAKEVADTLAELKRPRTKTIEMEGPNGKITAKVST